MFHLLAVTFTHYCPLYVNVTVIVAALEIVDLCYLRGRITDALRKIVFFTQMLMKMHFFTNELQIMTGARK